ncbi:molybdopterin cofactor-binding domain-containing protein [Rhodococcus sp. NPDC060084]|uniref:molybdopterin cofactor-binding domain-containing protein n=1 Tax=Rhodococcus sp. NPDC060084 TaxID=3347053 RepID=UPI00365218EF
MNNDFGTGVQHTVAARPAVGRVVRPVDWEEKTSGTALYAGDLRPDGMLYAKIVRATRSHATISSVDLRSAWKVPGVRAVVDARDLPPDSRYTHSGGVFADRPPFATRVVHFYGQEIAAVAADSPEAAAEAVRRIRVRYRNHRASITVDAARSRRAPLLHDRGTRSNVSLETSGTWGDEAVARAHARHGVSGVFEYPRVSHACMEPNTTLAWWHGERLELWTSTQAAHFVIHELAALLGLETSQVVCRDVAVGGSFGSKSKVSEHEIAAALLSMKTGRPVLVEFTRDEELATTKPRHGFRTELEMHADGHGRICRLDARIDVDNGAFNHYGPSVMSAGVKVLGSMYRPDAVTWRARLIDTNLTPGGQFRGYGQPQTALASECLVDELAERCGVDPLEFRRRNAATPQSQALSGSRVGSNRLVECLDVVEHEIGWKAGRESRIAYRGYGVAAGMHGSGSYAYPGGNASAAAIEATTGGRVIVKFGGSDAGTGQRTILAQIAADTVGVPFEVVDVVMTDWDEAPPEMGAWSSRGTHMGGHAVMKAAQLLADRLWELGGAHGSTRFTPDVLGALVARAPETRDGVLRVEADYAEKLMEPYWTGIASPNISASYTFAAHAAEVEVDEDTGQIRILDYVAAHDMGRAINPALVDGQIIGGIVQGLGAVLGEQLVYENGRPVNTGYVHYPLPRSTTAPSIRAFLVEGPEPAGPFDAKSVGEMAIVPVAAAVLNAVYDATGIRFRSLPITPDVVLSALRQRDGAPARSFRLARRPSRWQIEAFRRLYPLGLHHLLDRVGTRFARDVRTCEIEALAASTTVSEVTSELESRSVGDVAVIGGGTDLLVQREQRLTAPRVLVSTRTVEALRRITREPDGSWTVGAAVTLRELGQWARGELPILADVVDTIASPQLRETATVGGNLGQAKRCWFFRNGFDCYKRGGVTCPCYAVTGDHRFHHAALGAHRCQAVTPSDLATVFSALDATIRITGPDSSRSVSITGLYSGPGELSLTHGEIAESVSVPAAASTAIGHFEKIRLYDGDFATLSLAMVVVTDDAGRWSRARLCFGALGPTPWHPEQTETALRGTRPDEDDLVALLDDELSHHAHPLPGNAWKIDAAGGLARKAHRKVRCT